MKNLFYLFLGLMMMSCGNSANQKSPVGQNKGILPSSNGVYDEIVLVMDEDLYTKTPAGDTLFNLLTEEYPVLPQLESRFSVAVRVAFQDFTNVLTRNRNVIVVGHAEDASKSSQLIQKFLESGDKRSGIFMLKNVWASPQNVLVIYGKNHDDLFQLIGEKGPTYLNGLADNELKYYGKLVYNQGTNNALKEQLNEIHDIQLDVPNQFKLAKNEGNFLWLRNDLPDGTLNLMISHFPLDSNDNRNHAIYYRDYLGKQHIEANLEGSFMYSDSILPYQVKRIQAGQLTGYDTRGLWRMYGEFMGGPFMTYYVPDPNSNRAVLVDAFIYGPAMKKKRLYMRQLETILKTLELS